MNAVPFDTLKMARGLEAAGFPREQAAGVASTLAEAMLGADVATKADIAATKADIAATKADIAELRAELNGGFAEVDNRFDRVLADIDNRFAKQDSANQSLRTEFKSEIALVRGGMELLGRDLVIRLGGMIFLAAGLIVAAMRYLPPHP